MTTAADTTLAPPPADDAPWFLGAIATIRARLWFIIVVAGLCFIGAVIYLRVADYKFATQLRVAPAPTSARETGNLGALGTLASLTNTTVEAVPVTPFRLYLEGINSREIATRLAADEKLMRAVFADEWDPTTNSWREPRSLGRSLRNGTYGLVGIPVTPWSPPDPARLQGWIYANLAVVQSPKTPVSTLNLASTDPAFARMFLMRLHTTVDAWLRERALLRTRNNIAYINQRLPTVELADHRQALFATLSDQQQRDMSTRNPAAFAAEIFGNPTTSSRPSTPQQIPTLVAGLVLGALFGTVLALVIPRRSQP